MHTHNCAGKYTCDIYAYTHACDIYADKTHIPCKHTYIYTHLRTHIHGDVSMYTACKYTCIYRYITGLHSHMYATVLLHAHVERDLYKQKLDESKPLLRPATPPVAAIYCSQLLLDRLLASKAAIRRSLAQRLSSLFLDSLLPACVTSHTSHRQVVDK